MKHLSSQTEDRELSLGSALEVRCGSIASVTVCGNCQTCLMPQKVREFREWFSRFGDHSKKQFMLGLLQRIRCQALLKNLVLLLQPTVSKDCIYARARTNPSLETDTATVSSDRAISATKIEQVIATTWEWFSCATYFTKMNFTLSLLQVCDTHLLHILYRQATALLTAELKKNQVLTEDDRNEVTLMTASEYYHPSNEHTELDLLSQSHSEYCPILKNPFTGETIPKKGNNNVLENTTDISSLSSASSWSFDHELLLMPTPAEAYAGVSEYKDFVRYLPVHLSKMILSMLDMASLYNALCVSPNWRKLAEEVRFEIGVTQQIKEEVMLMQGAAAHSANPVYAKDIDVLVPNLEPGTHNVIYTSDDVIKTTFKSEHSFQTAYSGVSTRKVIMEERNIFCGTYNVMVVVDTEDNHRVVHTDGSNRVAMGSKDRKVRFADCTTGKEIGPIITGHAGSVTCCYLLHDKDMVISGSYDTSVRCWSITTGKCLKIMRGHQDTVNCITVLGSVVSTGAMDKTCKIWSLETGKCQKTFKHWSAVLAVALSEEMCISGCESGKVKVWELGSGNLIKILTGHHASVMGIKFDRWHIITGSKDGYALVWSTVGRHSRCLTALRHPKEVLCLEFAYLRVVTGSADGRIRIWNIVTGQCCRIMRGNSQSDPIRSIIATGDRITVNTLNSLLVMNFEKVNWDYTLETDKVSPLVRYASYSDAPLRSQPYSYVRAQRMRKAGASNCKIIHHNSRLLEDNKTSVPLQHQHHNVHVQLPHSAKSLSSKSLRNAKHVQSSLRSLDMSFSLADTSSRASQSPEKHSVMDQSVESSGKKIFYYNSVQSAEKSKSRNKSASSQVNILVEKQSDDDDDKGKVRETSCISRRVSWAFEKPLVSKGKDISLSEMKDLLRSQIRMKAANIVPPDFIYLTVSTIQKSMVAETNNNTKMNQPDLKPNSIKKRPSSSPSRIDPRTKVPGEKLGLEAFYEDWTTSPQSNLNTHLSPRTKEECKPPPFPSKECFTTVCTATPLNTLLPASLHPDTVKTTIPRGLILRPISAGPAAQEYRQDSLKSLPPRPSTSPDKAGSPSFKFVPVSIVSSLPGAGSLAYKSKSDLLTSTSQEASHVPMIMYTKEAKEKIALLKTQRRSQQTEQERSSNERPLHQVYNNPLSRHVKFELVTHQQEQDHLIQTELLYADQRRKENQELQKKKKEIWLTLATGKPKKPTHQINICTNEKPAD